MPIYEFACPACRRIYSFLGKTSDRKRRPSCPKCGRRSLGRVPSVFAVSARGGKGEDDGGPGARDDEGSGPGLGPGGAGGPGGPDELDRMPPAASARMERELGRLMSQAEGLDENDPRAMGSFLRRMSEVAGLPRDAAMEEAIRRMEAGEDPERVEEELGDIFGGGPGEGDDEGGGMGGYGHDDGMYSF